MIKKGQKLQALNSFSLTNSVNIDAEFNNKIAKTTVLPLRDKI